MVQPSLVHYQEFKQTLETYHLSQRAKKALEGLRLVLLVGPTSSGRNTVATIQGWPHGRKWRGLFFPQRR
jgi:hypothetical protein